MFFLYILLFAVAIQGRIILHQPESNQSLVLDDGNDEEDFTYNTTVPLPDLELAGGEPSVMYTPLQTPPPVGVPLDSWALDRIDQAVGYDGVYNPSSISSNLVDVYVVDTGINRFLNEFARQNGSRVIGGVNVVHQTARDRADTTDCHGHGTMMAGLIGGKTYGVSPGVNLWSVKVMGCNGVGRLVDVLSGLTWIRNNILKRKTKRAVVNLSIISDPSPVLDDAIQRVINVGAIVVGPGGNTGRGSCESSPGRMRSVITTGATTYHDLKWTGSASGPCIDIYAPGVDVRGPKHDGTISTRSGTSSSTALVTGAVAQILAKSDKPIGRHQVMQTLRTNSDKHIIHEEGNLMCPRVLPSRIFLRIPSAKAPKPTTTPQWLMGNVAFMYWNTTIGKFFEHFELDSVLSPTVLLASRPLYLGLQGDGCSEPTKWGDQWILMNGAGRTIISSNMNRTTTLPFSTNILRVFRSNGLLTLSTHPSVTVQVPWVGEGPVWVSTARKAIVTGE